ncbi:sporulation protein YpjB [Neobacillus notoginsengisoli]|uniref:Sporulation protein YpjB n=1 Tax=Neobacillus notoginsengisoli TaxID=1578198 RepID=A0A417YVN5_9BACI|nr:sporulation protein YpjB [Neobacillus notoginsengisoli]RHW41262.1 sporulation protein YpjB [Neobacillus notoginsengisoli]
MKLKCLLIILIIFLSPVTAVADGQPAAIERLDSISDDAFQMAKNQRYAEARKLLNYFSEQFNGVSKDRFQFSMDEARIITVSHDEAMEALASPALAHLERLNKVTRFRLVMDALATSSEPLWLEMEDQIMSSFTLAKKSALEGDQEGFHANVNSFLSLYNLIYPSMKIDLSAENIQRLDVQVGFLEEFRPTASPSQADIEEFEALEASLQTIFDGIEEDEADPSLWWVISSTGSIIIMTLSYVGWKKFKADKKESRKRSNELKD